MPAIHIWDLCTRSFHWILVLAVATSLATGLSGGFDAMDWHVRSGYLVLGLLIFRLLWGVLGSDYSRFSDFPLSPRAAHAYLGGRRQFPGHNPLGAWMIVVMLLALTVQAVSGLMTSDGLFLEGPWVFAVGSEWSSVASAIHKWTWWLVCGLIALHLLAVAVYAVRGQNLVTPMITGKRHWPDAEAARRPSRWWLRAVLLIAATALGWALITLP